MKALLKKFLNLLLQYEIPSIILLKLFLEVLFYITFSKTYNYSGYVLNFCFYKYLISWIVILPSLKLFKKMINSETFSNMIVSIIYILYFIPLSVLYGMMDLPNYFFIVSMIYMYCFLYFNYKINYIKIKVLESNKIKMVFNFLLIAIPAFVFIVSYIYSGFRITFDFINVYGIRLEASKYNIPTVIAYLFGFMDIFIPVLLLYSLMERKYINAVLMAFTQLVFFSFSAQKSFIVIILIVFFGKLCYKKGYLKYLPFLIVGCIFLYFVEKEITGKSYILALLYGRNIFLPPLISCRYFDFFTNNPFDLFTNGIMKWFQFKSIYPVDIPSVIGNIYGTAATSMNNGMIGDSFSNIGILGSIVLPLIMVIIFRVVDAFTYKLKRNLIIGFVIYYAMKFINTSWSITVLSGGLIILILMLYMLSGIDGNNDSDFETKDNSYLNFKKMMNSIKIYKMKIILSTILLLIVGVTYGYILSKKVYTQNEYKLFEITITDDEIKNIDIYMANYNQSKLIVKEIDDFFNIFPNTNFEKECDELNSVFNEIKKEEFTYYTVVKAVDDKELYFHSPTNPLCNSNMCVVSSKQFEVQMKKYFSDIDRLYKLINEISLKLVQNNNMVITYNTKNNLIYDYNISFNSNYRYNHSSVLIMSLFLVLTTLAASLYIAITKYNNTMK